MTTGQRGRHGQGRPVAELLEQAAEQRWDTSLLSVHARLHQPYVPPLPPVLPSRWTWTGDLDLDDNPPTLVRSYVRPVEPVQPEPNRTAC